MTKLFSDGWSEPSCQLYEVNVVGIDVTRGKNIYEVDKEGAWPIQPIHSISLYLQNSCIVCTEKLTTGYQSRCSSHNRKTSFEAEVNLACLNKLCSDKAALFGQSSFVRTKLDETG